MRPDVQLISCELFWAGMIQGEVGYEGAPHIKQK